MNSPDISRLTDRERKTYSEGMAIVKKRLATCHKPTAAEIEAESVRKGNAEIVKRFGSKIAKSRFGIDSTKHVDSPSERFESAIEKGVARAVKNFTTAKPSKAPTPAPSTARASYHAGRTIKRLCTGGGLFGHA